MKNIGLETVVQRLERLYKTDNWTQKDKEWLTEYLKEDTSELYFISLEGFSKDALEEKISITHKISNKVLNNIHKRIQQPKTKLFNKKLWISVAVAASIASVFGLAYLYKNELENWRNPVKYQETVTAKGEVKLIQLEDGTNIWLNADSRISYPNRFKGKTREVTLTGEAYFKVAHDVARRFIIHTGKINTEVLGTSFNVKAYKEDKTIKVAVISGKVGVVAKECILKSCSVLLTPNMLAVFNKNKKQLFSEKLDNASAMADWYQGNLHYHNTPVADVLGDIQRKYNIVIKADKNLLNCKLYADFNNLPLQKVLNLMSSLINAHVLMEGTNYRLKGKGCN